MQPLIEPIERSVKKNCSGSGALPGFPLLRLIGDSAECSRCRCRTAYPQRISILPPGHFDPGRHLAGSKWPSRPKPCSFRSVPGALLLYCRLPHASALIPSPLFGTLCPFPSCAFIITYWKTAI